MMLKIASVFATKPGLRSPKDGPNSGEEFLEKHLTPSYEEACTKNDELIVDLDGTAGYATSFLEASFGGLARKYPIEDVKKRIRIISNDEPYLIEEVAEYISEARAKN
jgi:hypothetical protein